MKIKIDRFRDHYPAKATIINKLMCFGFELESNCFELESKQYSFSESFLLHLNGERVLIGLNAFYYGKKHLASASILNAVNNLMDIKFVF